MIIKRQKVQKKDFKLCSIPHCTRTVIYADSKNIISLSFSLEDAFFLTCLFSRCCFPALLFPPLTLILLCRRKVRHWRHTCPKIDAELCFSLPSLLVSAAVILPVALFGWTGLILFFFPAPLFFPAGLLSGLSS